MMSSKVGFKDNPQIQVGRRMTIWIFSSCQWFLFPTEGHMKNIITVRIYPTENALTPPSPTIGSETLDFSRQQATCRLIQTKHAKLDSNVKWGQTGNFSVSPTDIWLTILSSTMYNDQAVRHACIRCIYQTHLSAANIATLTPSFP